MWKRQKGGIGGDSEGHQELGPHLSGHPLVQGLPETVSPSRPEPEKNLFFFFFPQGLQSFGVGSGRQEAVGGVGKSPLAPGWWGGCRWLLRSPRVSLLGCGRGSG